MAETFDDVCEEIARILAEAASSRKSPMHTPVVATADADARVMVLRDFDADNWTLRFHTDTRAPKAQLIGNGAPVGVLFYDKPGKVQIRARGTGRIESTGPVADAAWDASDNFARRCYLGEGPGMVSDAPTSGLPPKFEGVEPTARQLEPGRSNFSVLLVCLEELDWFTLAHTGHCRALLKRGGEGSESYWQGQWITP